MPPSQVRAIFLVVILISGSVSLPTGSAGAVGELTGDLQAPDRPTAGEPAQINASFSIVDVVPLADPSSTLQTSLVVDGTAVATQNVTLTDGGEASVNYTYTFSDAGNRSVEIQASVTFEGVQYNSSVSQTVSVTPEPIGPLDLNVTAPETAVIEESVPLNATLSLPDAAGVDANGTVTVTATASGETVAERSVTLSDGENKTVTLNATFNRTGTITTTITATGTVGNTSVSASSEREISISAEAIGNLTVSADVPSRASIGDSVPINATISLPDAAGVDAEGNITVELRVNGSTQAQRAITLSDGEEQTLTLNATFNRTGTATVTITANGTVGSATVTAETSRQVRVTGEAVGNLSLRVSPPSDVVVNESVTINTSVSLPDAAGTNASGNVTLTLEYAGSVQAERTVTITDGENRTVGLTTVFTRSGEVTVTVTATGTVGSASVSASKTATVTVQQTGNLSLTATIPETTTVGNETRINGTVSIPDLPGTVQANITVRLQADGTTIAEQTVTVGDGQSRAVAFTPIFNQSGNTTVTLQATGQLNGRSVSASVSRTVQVRSTIDTGTRSGVVFAVPPSLEDEVEQYRDTIGAGDELQAFILAQQDALRVVFTTTEPQKGLATVEGPLAETTFEFRNLTFGGIIATDVEYTTIGNTTTVPRVVANPEAFRLELVRINATYRRFSTLTDPDQGNEFTAVETAGVLVESPTTASQLFDRIGTQATRFSLNASIDRRNRTAAAELRRLVNRSDDPVLPTLEFEEHFAADAPATVDGVVLSPGTAARKFASTVDQANLTATDSAQPILYVVDESFNPVSVSNVTAAKSRADGTVIEVSARLLQARLSTQESLEHYTENCDDTRFPVQTPNGPVCVNIIQDVLVHGGVAFNGLPTDRDDVVLLGGLSSREVDKPLTSASGQYRIVGEVVRTSRIDPRLPNGSAILIYRLNKTDELDLTRLGEDTRELVTNRTDEVRQRLQSQVNTTANISDREIPERPSNGTGPVGEPPERLADFRETRPLQTNQTSPPSLSGKIRVERSVVANTTVTLSRNTSTNYTLSITVSGNASNVTFYLQKRAISSSQNISNVVMRIDGQQQPFYLDEDAGPGRSPWVAFEVAEFSTRTVSFVNDSGSGTQVTPGDANNDGAVTSADATLVLRYVVGLDVPESFSVEGADINDDGSVTSADATLILREVVGLR